MKISFVVILLAVLSGCSARDLYHDGRFLQEYQCSQIQDYNERSRCLEGSKRSYEEYQDDLDLKKGPQE